MSAHLLGSIPMTHFSISPRFLTTKTHRKGTSFFLRLPFLSWEMTLLTHISTLSLPLLPLKRNDNNTKLGFIMERPIFNSSSSPASLLLTLTPYSASSLNIVFGFSLLISFPKIDLSLTLLNTFIYVARRWCQLMMQTTFLVLQT